MPLVLALDAGTTNLKAGLVDSRGKVVSLASRPMKIIRDRNGAAEHSPEGLWREAGSAIRSAVRGREKQVASIVLSGYQMGLLAMDAHMRPMTGMATILDTRPGECLASLEPHIRRLGLYRRTGCPPFAQYQLARLWWMARKQPGILRKCRFLLGSKEYLAWKLCGEVATEPSTASATQMMDLRKLEWDREALALAGIRREMLPPITRGDRIMGRLQPSASRETGLPGGIPVIPGLYDGGALALGLGAMEKGAGIINLGTSAMYRACLDKPVVDKFGMRLQTYAFLPGLWLVGAGVNNAGVALDWFMSAFGVTSHREMERMARLAMHDSGVPLTFPYLTGERDPRIGSRARGIMVGLRSDHGRGALALSVYEGTGFSLGFIQDALSENGVRIRRIRAGGGGMRIGAWAGIIAGILGRPLSVSRSSQPGLAGCGMIGFTATGEYPGLETASRRMSGPTRRIRALADAGRRARFSRYSRALADISRAGLFSA